ncbi:hypothetical protein KIPB_002064 [Kipferlia bialata]|uniref:non-specific serine/threonine protein kinase n=1 Tax=Kipferlia bialata TaxID=797122 RepID=A0A9K3GFX2_9EUKA|nr:hypothetical protein KIPB_002064 [Kipferlia bialata]|eukprot:g2064.t1
MVWQWRYHDHFINGDAGNYYDHMVIVMEMLEGTDLRHFCAPYRFKDDRLTEREIKERYPHLQKGRSLRGLLVMIEQMLEGLAELHRHRVIHRDIKPANIRVCTVPGTKNMTLSAQEVSPLFRAPETFKSICTDGYGLKIDIWSLGITISRLITDECVLGFPCGHMAIQHRLETEGPRPLTDEETGIPGLADIVNSMLQPDPAERPNCITLLGMLHDVQERVRLNTDGLFLTVPLSLPLPSANRVPETPGYVSELEVKYPKSPASDSYLHSPYNDSDGMLSPLAPSPIGSRSVTSYCRTPSSSRAKRSRAPPNIAHIHGRPCTPEIEQHIRTLVMGGDLEGVPVYSVGATIFVSAVGNAVPEQETHGLVKEIQLTRRAGQYLQKAIAHMHWVNAIVFHECGPIGKRPGEKSHRNNRGAMNKERNFPGVMECVYAGMAESKERRDKKKGKGRRRGGGGRKDRPKPGCRWSSAISDTPVLYYDCLDNAPKVEKIRQLLQPLLGCDNTAVETEGERERETVPELPLEALHPVGDGCLSRDLVLLGGVARPDILSHLDTVWEQGPTTRGVTTDGSILVITQTEETLPDSWECDGGTSAGSSHSLYGGGVPAFTVSYSGYSNPAGHVAALANAIECVPIQCIVLYRTKAKWYMYKDTIARLVDVVYKEVVSGAERERDGMDAVRLLPILLHQNPRFAHQHGTAAHRAKIAELRERIQTVQDTFCGPRERQPRAAATQRVPLPPPRETPPVSLPLPRPTAPPLLSPMNRFQLCISAPTDEVTPPASLPIPPRDVPSPSDGPDTSPRLPQDSH